MSVQAVLPDRVRDLQLVDGNEAGESGRVEYRRAVTANDFIPMRHLEAVRFLGPRVEIVCVRWRLKGSTVGRGLGHRRSDDAAVTIRQEGSYGHPIP